MSPNLKIEQKNDYLLVNGNKIFVDQESQKFILEEHENSPDQSAIKQFSDISKLPGFLKSIGLPDFHIGYALPIGSVAVIDLENEDASISPNGVGFDINCGVRCLKTNIFIDNFPSEIKEKIGDELKDELPFENVPEKNQVSKKELNEILEKGMEYLKEQGIISDVDLERTESRGSLKGNSSIIGQRSKARGMAQLGTLGSGNHYLEIEFIDQIFDQGVADVLGIKKGQLLISIHTGSRGLGHGCCSDVLEEIDSFNRSKLLDKAEFKKEIQQKFREVSEDESLSKEEKQKLYTKIKEDLSEERKKFVSSQKAKDEILQSVPFRSEIGKKYYEIMNTAANFAWVNRSLITQKVKKIFSKLIPNCEIELISDVCHNIGKVEVIDGKEFLVLRKGASRILPPHHPELPELYQKIGQPILIGGSMGTSSHLIVGAEGAKDTFYSSCHGAGRLVSRSKAKVKFTYEEVIKDMNSKGISYRSGSAEGMVEESPGCYKNVDLVVDHTEKVGICKKVCSVKPILVIKG